MPENLMKCAWEKRITLVLFEEEKINFVRKMAKITTFLSWVCIVTLFTETCCAFCSRRHRR